MDSNDILHALSGDQLSDTDLLAYIRSSLKDQEDLQTRMMADPMDSPVYRNALVNNKEVIDTMQSILSTISNHRELSLNEKEVLGKLLTHALDRLETYGHFSGFKPNYQGIQDYLKRL